MKANFTAHRSPEIESHHQIQLSVTPKDNTFEVFLPFRGDIISIF